MKRDRLVDAVGLILLLVLLYVAYNGVGYCIEPWRTLSHLVWSSVALVLAVAGVLGFILGGL